MNKSYVNLLLCFVLMVLISGCRTSGIKVRAYAEDVPRVDQKMEGNAGHLVGKPDVIEEPDKATRRIYVFEMTKGVDQKTKVVETNFVKIPKEPTTSFQAIIDEQSEMPAIKPKINLPSFEAVEGSDEMFALPDDLNSSSSVVKYTVTKDDTLQKISKKFYDAYSKWPKIYEVNKAKIKNPDFLKPGIILDIPME